MNRKDKCSLCVHGGLGFVVCCFGMPDRDMRLIMWLLECILMLVGVCGWDYVVHK